MAAKEMATAANSLIASFTPAQKAAGVFAMDHDHRLDWHFIPKERKGTTLKDMTPQQRHLTTALLAASRRPSGEFTGALGAGKGLLRQQGASSSRRA